jgi:putative hemolysin
MFTLFIFSILFIAVAIWLEAVRSAINSLSGGYVRSLDEKKARKAELWNKDKKAYSFVLRALSFILTISFTCFIYHVSFVKPLYTFENDQVQTIKQLIVFALLHCLYLICREAIGAVWLSTYRYSLLKLSMPIINILRMILKPYELILQNSYKHTKKNEEKNHDDQEASAEDEILSLVENDDKSQLEDDERRMIQGVFDLNDKIVKEAMTPRIDVIGINIDQTPEEAIKALSSTNFSRLPVYEENLDNIKGLIYAKDFLDQRNISSKNLKSYLHKSVLVPESTPLDDLLEEFRRSHHHMAIVQDEYGGTNGIITIEDILEEIVGEILDEYDDIDSEYEITSHEDESYTIDAKATIDDINKVITGPKLPDEDDFDNIGGCIYTAISRIPTQGEIIQLQDYEVCILAADERSILKIKLSPKAELI